jgi:hypothetical protein
LAAAAAPPFDRPTPEVTTELEGPTVGVGSSSEIATASPLLIRRHGESWHSPALQAYSDEEMLKLLLRESPQMLPTYAEGTVIVDELTVPLIGAVDLAAVGPDGSITLVECKLSSNPEIRRSIIGQIFAYAAGLWRMKYDDFDRVFALRNGGVSLADGVRAALLPERQVDWPEEQFRLNVADNLESGRFTLVIAVDRITDELKRVVPYINSHTVSEVQFLALEITYVRDGDVEVVRPLTYGQESVAEKRATSQRQAWSPDAYFEKLRDCEPRVQQAVNALVAFSKDHGAQFQGGTGSLPSLNVQFVIGDKKKTVWSSYYYASGPSFDLNFDYLRPVCSLDVLEACAQTMQRINGVADRYSILVPDFRARPSLPQVVDTPPLQSNCLS